MPPTIGYKYPLPGNTFGLGKLPPIRRKNMERRLCLGRVWIFLILGVVLLILGLVCVGVYFNIEALTSSTEYTEVVPHLLNIAAILITGLCVSVLFWKRLKVFVFIAVIVCIACGLLCGMTAVLNTTHILKPIQAVTNCRYYLSQKLCQCFSPYDRDMLSLEFSETDLTKYDFKDTTSCSSIQEVLPQLLYTLIAVYAVVLLVCIGSAVVALLVLRIETNKRNCFQDENYEEVYTVSGTSSHDPSDSEPEIITTNQEQGHGSQIPGKTHSQRGSNSDTINSNRSGIPSVNSNRSGTLPQTVGRSAASSQTSLQQTSTAKSLAVQRSRTPGLNDLGKESLANRYKINKTPDREVPYRQRISKTPDREVGSRRRNSLNLSKRLSKSCDSLESSGREGSDKQELWDTGTGKGKGKLKDHRRRGKRAATVHTLDRDQLLLILSLQMRYLQETQEKETFRNTQTGIKSRRAITPQPSSQKAVIPQKVRSHTPQPYKSSHREKDPKEKEFYDQIETLLFRSKQKEQQRLVHQKECGGWGKRTRNFSDTSIPDKNSPHGNLSVWASNQRTINDRELVGKHEKLIPGIETYLTSQQIYKTGLPIRAGEYSPYKGQDYNSVDSVHYITYTDKMLSKETRKPLSRASVQNSSLPPEPIHRNLKSQLPPQPLSRQRVVNQPLPPQPIHRGQSAFQVVDRSSKSRSPSVASDINDFNATAGKTSRTDQADAAIRENFQMNPSPFMLQYSKDGSRNMSRNINASANENAVPWNRRGKLPTPPTEILPPYSGPPSYHEYVSSCEHSVTSSLSSNPDDVYSFPKRRVNQEEELTNHRRGDRISSSQYAQTNSNEPLMRNVVEHIYGNQESYQQIPNTSYSRGQHQRSTNNSESYYSSPSRSRVKQFIVPEDYYTPIHKIQKQKERTKYQNTQVQAYPTGKGQVSDSNYGNLRKTSGRLTNAYYADFEHQIGPDAKYHEYEDVYDTISPQGVPTTKVQPNGLGANNRAVRSDGNKYQPHSLNTHGFETPNSRRKPKKKSKDRNPAKSKQSYPVSNVNARVLNFAEQSGHGVNDHVTASVQNVHAENMLNIPKIKLNSVDTEEDADDDVFTDSDIYTNNFDLLKNQNCDLDLPRRDQNMSKQTVVGVNLNDGVSADSHIQNQPIISFSQGNSRTNENADQGNHVTDSGYMKMTLPISSTVGNGNLTNRNGPVSHITNHMTGGGGNSGSHVTGSYQVDHMTGGGGTSGSHVTGSYQVDHMTGTATNQEVDFDENERQLPDGNEADAESRNESKSDSDFEETGV